MKAMEGGNPAERIIGENDGRHTRALAKRCIILTEENRVSNSGEHVSTTLR